MKWRTLSHLVARIRAMPTRCVMRFELHTPQIARDVKTLSLPWIHGKWYKCSCQNPAMLACDAKSRHVIEYSDAKCLPCDLDSRCSLACDASALDAKSLGTRVERCEPLGPRLWQRPKKQKNRRVTLQYTRIKTVLPNFEALSWFFLKEKPQSSYEPGGLVNSLASGTPKI